MIRLLPIDIVSVGTEYKIVCIETEVFKPERPFFVEDLFENFPEVFSSELEGSETAFVRKMYYTDNQKILYFTVQEFIEKYENIDNNKKLGFIFHMSRCGSTLFSNLLNVSGNTVVYSEPTIINAILDPEKDIKNKGHLVKAAINALSGFSLDSTNCTVIKFRSWNVFFIDEIFSMFRYVPTVFIHRNGLEILSSVCSKPPGWLRARKTNAKFFAEMLKIPLSKIIAMSDEEYVLNVLKSFVDKILTYKRQKIVNLDYLNLKNDFMKVSENVYTITYSGEEKILLNQKMDTYSKDGKTAFAEDSIKKQEKYSSDLITLNNILVESSREKLLNN
jgi:hypothetical protein